MDTNLDLGSPKEPDALTPCSQDAEAQADSLLNTQTEYPGASGSQLLREIA